MTVSNASIEKNIKNPAPGLLKVLAIVAGLWAFSVVQPLFDLLAQNPQFLAIHDIGGGGLLALLAILLIPVPMVLALLIFAGYRVDRRVGLFLLSLTGFVLVTAGLRPILGRMMPLPGWWQFILAAGIALGLCLIAGKTHGIAKQLSWLAVFPLLFSLVFLFQPGPRSILFPPSLVQMDTSGTPVSTEPKSQPPVILVVFDAFPTVSLVDEDMEIDASLCPNLAAFAEDAIWYRNTMAVSPSTIWAVPAIMTGMFPDEKSSPNLQWYPNNIFTWLADSHRIQAFESETLLDPNSSRRPSFQDRMSLTLSDLAIIYLHVLLPGDLATGIPSLTNDWIGFAQAEGRGHGVRPDRQQLAEEFIASLEDGPRPGCYYLHVLIPHCPTQFLPSGNRYSTNGRPPSGQGGQWGKWRDDMWTVIDGHQRHLLQVAYADNLAGKIIQSLKDKSLYEKALVVFCADHGMSFAPGDSRRGVTSTNQGDILPVPLFIKYPGIETGSVDDRPARNIDILPTIAAALGSTLPWAEGLDLRNPNRPILETVDYIQLNGRRSAVVDSVLAQRQESIRIKHQRFGIRVGDNGLYAPIRGASLLGRPLPVELPLFPGNAISLDKKGPWISPDPSSGIVPAEVTAWIAGENSLPPQMDLAVAVDGVIRAVSRPYGRKPGSDLGIFSTILPEASLSPGEHSIQIVVADWSSSEPRLYATQKGIMQGLGSNLITSPLPNLKLFGLYKVTLWGDSQARWTNGSANLFLKTSGETHPASALLKLISAGPGEPSLFVLVNGLPFAVDSLPSGPWNQTIDLREIDFSKEVRIGFFSRTFVPAEVKQSSKDFRELGVAIQDITLRESLNQPTALVAGSPGRPIGPVLTIRPEPGSPATITGIYKTENRGGEPFAWTTDQAEFLIPWNQEGFPAWLFMSLADSGPEGTELSLTVNGQLVLQKNFEDRPQLELIELQGVPRENPLRIKMTCNTFSPKDHYSWSKDERELGVALRLFTLFGQASVSSEEGLGELDGQNHSTQREVTATPN